MSQFLRGVAPAEQVPNPGVNLTAQCGVDSDRERV